MATKKYNTTSSIIYTWIIYIIFHTCVCESGSVWVCVREGDGDGDGEGKGEEETYKWTAKLD